MIEKINKASKVEKIQKITIPDDDMSDWIKTLYAGGFTDAEIDSILSHLNATYVGKKREGYVNQELSKMEAEISKRRGYGFSDKEKTAIREGIESRFRIDQVNQN